MKTETEHYCQYLLSTQVNYTCTYFAAHVAGQQNNAEAVKQICRLRWCVEQLHREEKQLTGIQQSQCRLARDQRNHILAATLVWTRLKQIAYAYGQSVYQLKS